MSRKRVCGVYCIVHLGSGRRYVGMSTDVMARVEAHLRGYGGGSRLARAIAKHGRDAFVWGLIEACAGPVLALEREVHWIQTFGCMSPAGFNLTSGGDHPDEVSAETRALLSSVRRGRRRSPETVARMRVSALAARAAWTPEQRRADAERMQRLQNSETRARGCVAAWLGRKHTPETIEKIRAAKVGKPGRKHTPESIAKIRAARTGTRHSPATIEKIRESHRPK